MFRLDKSFPRVSVRLLAVGLVCSIGAFQMASAQAIVGGSNLLSSHDVSVLGSYLGESHLQVTRIFDKKAGDGKVVSDFHSSVDGLGRTFTLFHVSSVDGQLTDLVIGGYNPVSWNASYEHWIINYDTASRTAFIFNLTSGDLQRQRLSGGDYYSGYEPGIYQTYNSPFDIRFGLGQDIYVSEHLELGGTYARSYGTGSGLLDAIVPRITNGGSSGLSFSEIEVFTLGTRPAVPGPAAASVILCLGCSRLLRRRRGANLLKLYYQVIVGAK